jgi:hypothetical protein
MAFFLQTDPVFLFCFVRLKVIRTGLTNIAMGEKEMIGKFRNFR